MDQPIVAPNPPTKTPVARGARACTVCRAAKMKCVGAEDGAKRCQRCQRSGAECIFEKHRRGRKPGSKLSEASKMLRRLEKGLSTAKAKQPTTPAAPHPSTSASQYGTDDAPGSSSFPGPSNNPIHSGQQSDDEMDEDEEDRPDDNALYPANVIRKSMRSSFLDIVMNPEPPADHSRLQSGSPTDRNGTHFQPKAASHSPSRSYGSPQPKPCSGIFPNVPKDPVSAGIVAEEDVPMFFDAFFLRLNPFINLFDPALHSHQYVRSRSPFLFTTMLMACCKFFRPNSYQAVRRLAQEWCVYTFAEGIESVEVVQALACMTYWKEPADRRTWTYIGMAARMAVGLRLNRYVGSRQVHESETQMLERRNRERTYLVLFVHDRSLSMQTGKHWMLPEDELVRHFRSWHEDGALGQRSDIRPEDVIVAAFVHLRLIGSEATDTFYHRASMFESELHKYNSKLDEWLSFWTEQMHNSSLADEFHTAFLKFFQSHVRLFLNTFGLNLANQESGRTMPNPEAVQQCHSSARTNLQIVSNHFAGMHVLRYGQESITVMSAYAAIVLLKLLRNPTTMIQLRDKAEDIHAIIEKAADAYQSAGHVAGLEPDSAAYHARFLRRLTLVDRERASQQTEQMAYRADGVSSSFAPRLPPLRAPQPAMGPPMSQIDIYALPRPHPQNALNPPHLAPLTIPGSASQGFSHYADYSMDPAVRNGISQNGVRGGTSMYSGVQPTSESDESYYQYMISEVGTAVDGFFPDGSPHSSSAGGQMASHGVGEFGYGQPPSSHYRDTPVQMSYGGHGGHGHGHNRHGSYLPSMQSYANGFDTSR